MFTKSKKNRLIAVLALCAVLLFALCGLTACGESEDDSSSSGSSKTEVGTYIYGCYEEGDLDAGTGYLLTDYGMASDSYEVWTLKVYDDDTYYMVYTCSIYMYGNFCGIVVESEGTYTSSLDDDDYTVYSLSEATSLSYKTCGMSTLTITLDSTFPVERLGQSSASTTKDEFISLYGAAQSVTIQDNGVSFAFND